MTRTYRLLGAFLTFTFGSSVSAETIIHAGRWIDGTSDIGREDVSVVIVDGQITALVDGYRTEKSLSPPTVGFILMEVTPENLS